ncbi:hypothetical protein BUE93_21865 [Chromobacterium amazonense]|uniref:Uncharacterized protein n=1 Tax=Chromobacterium amazonense TaxID=1382803 RepID=A0A2S9WYJ3_9NEIS|nr:hypothetical protein [Chromobacterium amazonense]PRP68539.1 hypothetical protein BUE93_21865 [Chromobacterium amazonense]
MPSFNLHSRAELKKRFSAGSKPTAADFANLLDSVPNLGDDKLVANDALQLQISADASGKTTLTALPDAKLQGSLQVAGETQLTGYAHAVNLKAEQLALSSGAAVSAVRARDLQLSVQPDAELATVGAIRQYVAEASLGLTLRASAKAVAVDYFDVKSPPASVDGVLLAKGDTILLTNQGGGKGHPDNRLWTWGDAGWQRAAATDGDPYYELEPGTAVLALMGSTNGGKLWVMTAASGDPQWTPRTDLDYLSAGDGLKKAGLIMQVKLADNSGLAADASGLKVGAGNGLVASGGNVHIAVGNGLDAGADLLQLKLDPAGGLTAAPAGLKANIGPGLAISANALQVSTAGDSGLFSDAAGLKVGAGNGLVASGGNVHVAAGAGLDASADLLKLKLNSAGGLVADGNGLSLSLPQQGGLKENTAGLGLNIVWLKEPATQAQIDAALNAGAYLVATYL